MGLLLSWTPTAPPRQSRLATSLSRETLDVAGARYGMTVGIFGSHISNLPQEIRKIHAFGLDLRHTRCAVARDSTQIAPITPLRCEAPIHWDFVISHVEFLVWW